MEASARVLKEKFSRLEPPANLRDGYAYYCRLCDEILTLSRRPIDARKVSLVFDGACPGCGFELGKVLACEASKIPTGSFVNPKCEKASCLIEPSPVFEPKIGRAVGLPRGIQPNLATGMETLDKTLPLRLGQLTVLQGSMSHRLSLLLCVRATLAPPSGLGCDLIFLDGGNLFDAYSISERSVEYGLNPEKVLRRIHLSRAFTCYQLTSLITQRLPSAIDEFNAKLTVISDITLLFCDPDIRNKRETLQIFAMTVRSLATLAEQTQSLIIVTNLQSRNTTMNNVLLHTAHASAKLDDRCAFTQLTVARHPFTSQIKATVSIDPTLEKYL